MKIRQLIFPGILILLIAAGCQPTSIDKDNNPGEQLTEATVELEPITPSQKDPSQPLPAGVELEFDTDFTRSLVSFDEILSGGPPKDAIPAIDNPKFVSVESANAWLKPNEPVIQLIIGDEVKAYPIQILMWHEIANDSVGGVPVVVSFCPLCNTAIVYGRTVGEKVLDFGTTGRLRYSNLIMYDRQTESWWQQAEGRAIIGDLMDEHLEFFPAAMISWETFQNAHPNGLVLSQDTGFSRDYGRNPYEGYDDVNNPPFLYDGPQTPGELPAVSRVLTVDIDEDPVAYPFDVLKEVHVVNDTAGDQEIVIFWTPGTASALDARILSEGNDVGSASSYNAQINGATLSFIYDGSNFIDEQTYSTWDSLGRSVEGELKGNQLKEIVAINHLWFSWAVFKPETRIYQP
jgi:hypothetical protein